MKIVNTAQQDNIWNLVVAVNIIVIGLVIGIDYWNGGGNGMGKNTNMSRKERMRISEEFIQEYDREGEHTSPLTLSDGGTYYYNDVLREWCKDCAHWRGFGVCNCSQFCCHLPPDKFTERDIDMVLVINQNIKCD